MTYCRKCGTQLEENARFCHKCGTEVIASPPTSTTAFATPQTTEVLPVTLTISQEPSKLPTKKSISNRTIVALAVVIIVFIVVSVFVVIMIYSATSQANNANQANWNELTFHVHGVLVQTDFYGQNIASRATLTNVYARVSTLRLTAATCLGSVKP